MIIRDLIERTTQFFKQKDFPAPRLDAELLLASALNLERIELYTNFDKPVGETELSKCREYVKRRAEGEPVAYIVGFKDFYGHQFIVSQAVLIPRPETEHVVDLALDWLKTTQAARVQVADFGAGSGCIGLTLAKLDSRVQLTAIDLSHSALEVAAQNAQKLEVSERVKFVNSAVEDVTLGMMDLIVANPPYVSDTLDIESAQSELLDPMVKKYEPAMALFAADNGLQFIKSWSEKAATLLKPGGHWIFEIGADQGTQAPMIVDDVGGFADIKLIKDYSGRPRVISAVKK